MTVCRPIRAPLPRSSDAARRPRPDRGAITNLLVSRNEVTQHLDLDGPDEERDADHIHP